MTRNKSLFTVLLIIFAIWGCSNHDRSTKLKSIWVPYEVSSNDSILYYDRTQIPEGRHNILKIWTKRKFPKQLIDKHVQYRKDHNLSIDGWDKLDYEIILKEFDCHNQTRKRLLTIDYNDQDAILMTTQASNPKTEKILSGSGDEALLGIVCQ